MNTKAVSVLASERDPTLKGVMPRSSVPAPGNDKSPASGCGWHVIALCIVTVLTRLAVLPFALRMEWASGLPGSSDFWWGTDGYVVLARNLVETGRLAFAADLPLTVHRSPGFPATIAAAYSLVRSYEVAVLLVNFISAVIIAWCSYAIARRAYSQRAAFWIALFASLYPPAVYYSLTSWSETFIAAVFITYVTVSLRAMIDGRLKWSIAAGAALAAVLLSKTIFVAAPVAAFLFAVVFRRRWLYPLAVQFLVAALLVLPWSLRNHRLVHRPT